MKEVFYMLANRENEKEIKKELITLWKNMELFYHRLNLWKS